MNLMFPKNTEKKKRKKHGKSIIQRNKHACYICGKIGMTEEHHIFEGPDRKKSEEYGLKVYLCSYCHREGPTAVHTWDPKNKWLKEIGQKAFEEQIGTREEFMSEFRKNYL